MQRLIIGISGASGAVYGIRLLEELRLHPSIETHLVITHPAERTIAEETTFDLSYVQSLASYCHQVDDVGASIASGSFAAMGMVVMPCSMRSAAAIAHCLADNLLIRAADVTLKEARKLVLVVRESPLHAGHLTNLLSLARMGVIIMPPMPVFYSRPQTVEDIVNHSIGRVLDHFGLPHRLYREWGSSDSLRP